MSEAALAGLKVAVTGASGDIGRALCRSLAAEKAHLSLLGRDAEQHYTVGEDRAQQVTLTIPTAAP